MAESFTVACVQNCADDDLQRNLRVAAELTRRARETGAVLICLPEYFACIEREDRLLREHARSEDEHPALPAFTDLARELDAWILMGSIPIRAPDGRVNNRSFLLSADGSIVARYDKIHLFDVELKDAERYEESATVAPGGRAMVADTPWGALGMTVCYDVRFPHLYRTLAAAGASYLSIPAAFTRTTGRAHWHVLVRARAIETGCYAFAPGQHGVRPWGRATYGHSLIVDPWGTVLADGGEDEGFVSAEIDPDRVRECRRMIPALRHDRPIEPPAPASG